MTARRVAVAAALALTAGVAAVLGLAAAHRPELEQAWEVVRAQVEPLLEAYRSGVEAKAQATTGSTSCAQP